MADALSATALTFQDIHFDLVEHPSGDHWLTHPQIALALGLGTSEDLIDLYESHSADFTESMTALAAPEVTGGAHGPRLFSLRGAHVLGLLANTERSVEFRRWVLGVIEQQPLGNRYPPTVLRAVSRLMSQSEALRRNLLELSPKFRLVVRYHAIRQLTHAEKATLMGLKAATDWDSLLYEAAAMGLIDWPPSEPAVTPKDASRRVNHNASPSHMMKMTAAAAAKRAAARNRKTGGAA